MFSNKGYRNARKFQLKYGFDPHLYADAWALGLNENQMAELLGVNPATLANFRSLQARLKH